MIDCCIRVFCRPSSAPNDSKEARVETSASKHHTIASHKQLRSMPLSQSFRSTKSTHSKASKKVNACSLNCIWCGVVLSEPSKPKTTPNHTNKENWICNAHKERNTTKRKRSWFSRNRSLPYKSQLSVLPVQDGRHPCDGWRRGGARWTRISYEPADIYWRSCNYSN